MFEKFKKVVGAVAESVTDGAKKAAKAVKDALIDTDVREEGLSGAEIYRIFAQGDSRSLRSAAEEWRRSAGKYDEALGTLTAALRTAWPDWEGPAAMAARTAMAPLEQNLAEARDAAAKASVAIGKQADWFDLTKNKVHPLADNPPLDPGPLTAGMLNDMEARADAYHENADANRQFYREYVTATRQNLGTLPQFTPPRPTGSADQGVTAATSSAAWQSTGLGQLPAAPGSTAAADLTPGTTTAAQSADPTREPGKNAGPVEPSRSGGSSRDIVPGASGRGGEPGNPGSGRGGVWGGPGSGGVPVGPGPGRGAEPRRPGAVRGPGTPGTRPTTTATAQPSPAAPPPLGQPGKRDDEERSRRSRLSGPDPKQLFGLDEEPPPAVIGLWKEKKS